MKVGLWGYYGHDNFGDDLILKTLIHKIIKYEEENNITIFVNPKKEIKTKRNGISLVKRTTKNTIVKAFELDVLIIGPGGLLPHKNINKILFFILIGIILRLRKRKIVLYGIGIGIENLNNLIPRKLLQILFKLTNYAVVRQTLPFETKAISTYDFLLGENEDFNIEQKHKTNMILFSLANIFIPTSSSNYKKRFISTIIEEINYLMSKGYTIKLVSFSYPNDCLLNEEIINNLDASIEHLVYTQQSTEQIFNAFNSACLIVSMRFHSLVLALQYNTPVYSIAYSEKIEDLCVRYNMNDFYQRICCDIREYYGTILELDAFKLKEQIDYLLNHQESISQNISVKNQHYQKDVSKVYDNVLKKSLKFDN